MPTRRHVLGAAAGFVGVAGCTIAPSDDGLRLRSPAFDSGGRLPTRYTCEGANVSPPLRIGGVPAPAEALAVVCATPDSPGSQATQWLLWNLPAETTEIPADVPREPTVLGGARQGTNDAGRLGYAGPCPPPETEATVWFTLHALDAPLALETGADREAFDDALETHRIAGVILECTVRRSA
jgi:Raf kinase inhibitor-like YbhB/YbcL family protein